MVAIPGDDGRSRREPLWKWAGLLSIALPLGLLALAAVREMDVDCKRDTLVTNSSVPLHALNAQHCYLDMGDARVPLPVWAEALRR